MLLQIVRLSRIFRANFVGKASPIHFFWGSFDLATSLFSGRTAPPHPGGFPNMPDWATREAYSHEVFSVGLWPGGYGLDTSLYAYIYPVPDGLDQPRSRRAPLRGMPGLREFVLPYEAVRTALDPDGSVLEFFESAYAACADAAKWDRAALERPKPQGSRHKQKRPAYRSALADYSTVPRPLYPVLAELKPARSVARRGRSRLPRAHARASVSEVMRQLPPACTSSKR